MAKPTIPLTDKRFEYTPSHKTDIRETFRKAGWPFPAPGQIKRAFNESDRARVENKQAKADRMAIVRESEDALW